MTDEEADAVIEQVEELTGMGKGAWDMVSGRELARAFVAAHAIFHRAMAERVAQVERERDEALADGEKAANARVEKMLQECDAKPMTEEQIDRSMRIIEDIAAIDTIKSLKQQVKSLKDELDTAQRQVKSLNDELAEVYSDALIEIAGEPGDGWYCSNGRSTAVYYGDLLVAMGRWEQRQGGHGRVQWYRPKPPLVELADESEPTAADAAERE